MKRMTKTRIKILGIFLLAGIFAIPASAIELGDTMPGTNTVMQNVDGRKLTLGELQGEKGTLVIFACNHCPFVQAWQDRMAAIGNSSRTRGIGVAAINANDPKKYPTDDLDHMKQQAKEAGFEFPYLVDATSDVARAFGAKRTPEVFLFDAKDKLVYHGAIDDNAYKPDQVEKTYLKDAIDALLAGKTIPQKETRSVGCSIKFRPEQETGQ